VHISLVLSLPRDAASVPVTRRILRCGMNTLGVTPDIAGDVELAVTEACDNVITHSKLGDAYEVRVGITDQMCVIDVVDTGRGWDAEALQRDGLPGVNAEQGRGLHLIRLLSENVRFMSHPRQGAIVHFEKKLEWIEDAVIDRLV
jgi:serine/threonine-protein kinase RsbW